MSTQFIKVSSTGAAWDAARELLWPVVAGLGLDVFPGFVKDQGSSARAGYSVYRLAGWDDLETENNPANMQDSEKLYYNYVSDLGGVLELNTCGPDWSGDVYRIAIVSDGDGLQGSGVNSAEGSAAAGADSVRSSKAGAAAHAARRFTVRTRRGLRMICREKHVRTVSRSFDGSSVVMVQKWDVLRDGSIYARTLQGFFGPARRCGSWSEYVQQQRGYVSSIRREVAALVKICGGEVA